MEPSDPTTVPIPLMPVGADRRALLAARDAAAHQVYDAECALHTALQAARGARAGAESSQCDRWIAAAYAHLHSANVEYAAATAAMTASDQAGSGGSAAESGGTARAA
jgi:hypothetical protein